MLKNIPIKNKEIEKYRDYLQEIYLNENINSQLRKFAKIKIEIIESVVDFYENNRNVTFEDLTWNEIGEPILPEELKMFFESKLK